METREWKHEQLEVSKREITKRVMTEEKWRELSKAGTETYISLSIYISLHHIIVCPSRELASLLYAPCWVPG